MCRQMREYGGLNFYSMLIKHEVTVDRNKTPPGCIVFSIVQHTWNSIAILIVVEVL